MVADEKPKPPMDVAEERDKLLAILLVCIERLGGRVTFTHDELNDANEYKAMQVVDDNGVTLTLKAVAISRKVVN